MAIIFYEMSAWFCLACASKIVNQSISQYIQFTIYMNTYNLFHISACQALPTRIQGLFIEKDNFAARINDWLQAMHKPRTNNARDSFGSIGNLIGRTGNRCFIGWAALVTHQHLVRQQGRYIIRAILKFDTMSLNVRHGVSNRLLLSRVFN